MPSRKIEDLTIGMQESFVTLKSSYENLFPQRRVILTCTYRSPEEQRCLFSDGRSRKGSRVTNCDGIKITSKHNYYPAKAFDFAILKNNKALWDKKYYLPAGKIIKSLDLVWGGDWRAKDYCHVEAKD